MKQTQWTIAALVLAVMVFGLTFAVNYLGGTDSAKGDPGDVKPIVTVEFPLGVEYPQDGARLEQEENIPGHRDFWFVNRNDEPATVGLDKTNCRCSEVEAFMLPDTPLTAQLALLLQGRQNHSGPAVVLGLWREPLLAAAAQGLQGVRLKKDEVPSVQVPAAAVGFVRLHWTGEKTGQPRLQAILWMGSPDSGRTAPLQVQLTVHEPVRVKLGGNESAVLTDADLQQGVTRTIYAWSSTRRSFQLEARLSTVSSAAAEPVEVGKPEPLGPEELRELAKQNSEAPAGKLDGSVLCGYRIKVTLRAVSADGKTPFPVGPFGRRILLTSRDAGVVDKAVVISGHVEGVVRVAETDTEAGGVNFSTFRSSKGKKKMVVLESEVKGLKLEVDTERTAKFLSASVRLDARRGEEERWQLLIEVLPDKARGPFPRSEEGYKDCAVYLKALEKGKPPRLVRVAVQGIAGEG